MAFKKGMNKIGGRKRGTPNKVSDSMRLFYGDLLEQNKEKIQEALDLIFELDPSTYLKLVIRLSEFFLGKKREIDKSVKIDVSNMSESELNTIMDEIYKNISVN